MESDSSVLRYMSLFIGNQRSFGRYRANGSMSTERAAYTHEHVREHLEGKTGIGMVPILDDGTVRFAAIDIDAHDDSSPPIDVASLEVEIKAKNYPLTVCRSKGRGAHVYCFFKEPAPAAVARSALVRFATDLGFPKAEIFPKQQSLKADAQGNRPLGNWINLPYFGDTRRSFEGGQEVGLEYFLDLALDRSITTADLNSAVAGDEHSEAPPCFQKMVSAGVPKGEGLRNKALFHAAVYFKRAFPNEWRDRAFDFNSTRMGEPLSHSEAKKTIDSVSKREYVYRCKDEPCVSLCEKSICATRKFGVGSAKEGVEIPGLGNLKKFATDPVKWQLTVSGVEVDLNSDDLMNYRMFRKRVMESVHIIPPMVKNEHWDETLRGLMESVQIIEVSEEASTSGLMRAKLMEWVKRSSEGDSDSGRQAILRGVPIVTTIAGAKVVAFRYADFIDYLKRTRSEEMKGAALWVALQKSGILSHRLRVGNQVINAWVMPLPDDEAKLDPIKYDPEL